jgi:hypothetical protein
MNETEELAKIIAEQTKLIEKQQKLIELIYQKWFVHQAVNSGFITYYFMTRENSQIEFEKLAETLSDGANILLERGKISQVVTEELENLLTSFKRNIKEGRFTMSSTNDLTEFLN